MLYPEETEFDCASQSNQKTLDFEYFDSNCLPDESLTFDFSPGVPNLLSPNTFFHPSDIDIKPFELNDCDFSLNDFVNEEDGGLSSGEEISRPSTLLGSGFSNSDQQSPASWLMSEFIQDELAPNTMSNLEMAQNARGKLVNQTHPIVPVTLKSNGVHSRQPNGVISGRVKKREYVPPVIHIKKSPNTSPAIHVNQTPMTHAAYPTPRSQSSLPHHNIPILQRPTRPTTHYPSVSNVILTQPHSGAMDNVMKPMRDELDTKDYHAMPSSILKNYYADAFSSGEEDDSHSSPTYGILTTNMENSLRNCSRENSNAILLHSMNGTSLQSSTGTIITEEEMRVMASEGYPIPNLSFPLSKADEKILKKVRRKIKNKLSAQESRKKKKEYLEKLEKQADNLNQENITLKRRLEDVERRLEMVEVRNRQLMCRLSKVTNSEYSMDQQVNQQQSISMQRQLNGTNATRSSTNPPSSRCTNSNSNPNSTKFYIMAFVFFFSVLFAGDPSLMVSRPGAPPSLFHFPSSLLMSHSHSSRGLARALLSYYPNLYRPRYFSDVFCPAGVNHCHQPLDKWDRLTRPMARRKRNSSNVFLAHGREMEDLTTKLNSLSTPVKWMKRFHRAMNEDTFLDVATKGKVEFSGPFISQLIKTPSILLDNNIANENSVSGCSLMNFWKLLWKCEEEVSSTQPRSDHFLSQAIMSGGYHRNSTSEKEFPRHHNFTNIVDSMRMPSSLLLVSIK